MWKKVAVIAVLSVLSYTGARFVRAQQRPKVVRLNTISSYDLTFPKGDKSVVGKGGKATINATAHLKHDRRPNTYAWALEIYTDPDDGPPERVWWQDYDGQSFEVARGRLYEPSFSETIGLPPGEYLAIVGVKQARVVRDVDGVPHLAWKVVRSDTVRIKMPRR